MQKNTLFVNSGIYSLLNLIQKGINFLLIPVLTLYLTTFDYGIVAVVTAVNAFLNKIYILSLTASITRFYYEYEEDTIRIKRLLGSIVSFVLIVSTVLSIVLLLGHSIFLDPFLEEVDFFPFMFLGLLTTLFNPLFTIYQHTLQVKQKGKEYGVLNSVYFFINLSLLLVAVVVYDFKAVGVLGALATTNFIFFGYTLIKIKKEVIFCLDKDLLRHSLNYSLPLIPHSISGIATNIIDRLFINNILSTSLTGIYSIGSTFGGIIFLLSSGVNQAFVPWFNKQAKQDKLMPVSNLATILITIYSLVALGLSWFGKEIIELVTPESFHNAWKVVPYIAFAFVFHAVYYFFSVVYFYSLEKKGSRVLPIYTISAALFNSGLNIVLINKYGILGAALATLITKFLLSFALSINYQKYVNVNYSKGFLFGIPSAFFILSFWVYYSYSFWDKFVLFFLLSAIAVFFIKKKYDDFKILWDDEVKSGFLGN
jgi:O-antigen/teichoic acid export membrane protein